MKKKIIILLSGIIFILIVAGSYITWNRLEPDHTCAQCHEVAPSHARWKTSAHADLHCIECHGSAMSDGFHSLFEKTNMVFSHFTKDKQNEDIKLSEKQILQIHHRCIACHQAEYAGWMAGGHAVNYKEIYMDSTHNFMEKPYWDCLRCHGMFYDGNINDLMALESTNPSDWMIKDKKQELLPAIPCLACHRMHAENPVSERYVSTTGSDRIIKERNPRTALYMRADKMYLRSDKLSKAHMYNDKGEEITYASDPNSLLCLQCHAPDHKHHTGSEDDRTVTGVHEGISCIACHRPHSGQTKESCIMCHPSLTEKEIQSVFEKPHSYTTPE
jgi:hypothetical protein